MSKLSLRGAAWDKLCLAIKERDGWQCQQCGSEDDLTVDHVVPLALMTAEQLEAGLPMDPSNLLTRCRTCNGRKGARQVTRSTWFSRRWLSSV